MGRGSNSDNLIINKNSEIEHHGWLATEHDYDPEWDYEIDYHFLDHPLVKKAQEHLQQLAELQDTPFNPELPGKVFPSSSIANRQAIALYCTGTYTEPVILIDLTAHIDLFGNQAPFQITRSIEHEVYHAIQESEGLPMDEDDAETWQPPLFN
jgi:hypothetical protein